MKFKINKSDIYPSLSIMSKLPLSKKNSAMEKDSLFFEVKEGNLILESYDGYEVYMELSMPIDNEYYEEGVSRVEAKLFSKIMKSLNGEVYIEDTKKSFNIVNNKTRFELRSSAISDYLKNKKIVKVEDEFKKYRISKKVLKESLESVSVGVSSDVNRLEWMNVMWEIEDDKIAFISTDGYRIVKVEKYSVKSDKSYEKESFLFPSSAISTIINFLKEDDEVEILVSNEAICFIFDNVKLHVRKDNKSEFPDINKVMKMESGNKIKISKKDILKAIDQFQAVGTNVITLNSEEVSDGRSAIKIKSCGMWSNDKVLKGEVFVDMERKEMMDFIVSFKSELLKDGLRIIKDDDVVVTVKGEYDFIVIRGYDNKDITYLLLPCMR